MEFYLTLVVLIIFVVIYLLYESKRKTILEGVVVGVIGGLLIAFITDGNYRAKSVAPVIIKLKNVCKVFKDLKYTSKDWMNIKAKKTEDNKYNIEATSQITGSVVTFNNVLINELPPDLKYDLLTWGNIPREIDESAVELKK